MTDNEIIKALECCLVLHKCEECPCDFDTNGKTLCNDLGLKIFDLINRQKAEIEKLNIQKAKLIDHFTIDFDEERLEELCKKAANDIVKKELAKAGAEAIKEFGKFLIDKSQHGMILTADIPEYVKEMTEGENG